MDLVQPARADVRVFRPCGRAARVIYWVALVTALAAGACATTAGATVPPEGERLFLGRSFEGLPLMVSESLSGAFIYGDCTPPLDGGCAPPLDVQSWSICRRHPLEIDLRPQGIARVACEAQRP